jgi:tRNA G37 N-methylase Trm5
MVFKELLTDNLKKKKIELDYSLLPNGYQKIGDIVILNLNDELKKYEKEVGGAVLEVCKARSVCVREGGIKGELREPQIKVIAGSKDTEVCHFENGVYFCFDVSKIMFAKGNVAERGRLPKQVKMSEIIVDMFAGIGYFSVPIAKNAKPKKIYAIDLNPNSIKYLKKTIEKNKLNNIEVIQGDSQKIIEDLAAKGIKADRVLMGYLPPPVEFISSAMKIIKKNGIIHYDDLVYSENKEKDIDKTMKLFNEEAEAVGMKAKLINAQKVKSYRPKVDHYVLDIRIS